MIYYDVYLNGRKAAIMPSLESAQALIELESGKSHQNYVVRREIVKSKGGSI